MTVSKDQKVSTTGRKPSMFASILVFAVMVGLILLSVILFGGSVAQGPLQVSMTLATLVALGVAFYYGYRGALISQAISHSINTALGTIFILLAIGALIGTLYLTGTVAAFVYYGVQLLNPRFYYVTVFIIASLLGILTGSSFTTIGAVGVAFVGLAPLMGVSPAITAGAAVSGAFLGDKNARISDTFVLTTAVVGVAPEAHSRAVWRTSIPTIVISAVLFLITGFTANTSGTTVDPSVVQGTISQYYNVSLLALIPVILVFVLSGLRFSGFLSLMLSAIAAVILAAFTQQQLIIRLAGDPNLIYPKAVYKVAVDTIASGFHLTSGNEQLDGLFSGGGTLAMFETIWLILVAASFGAITDYTGMVQRLMEPVIRWAKGTASLMFTTAASSLGLNALAADPFVSIVLSARMFRDSYIKARLKPEALSSTIADSGTIASAVIPWNVHGAFVVGALGVGTAYAPYAFMCYLSPVVAVAMGMLFPRQNELPQESNVEEIYGNETKHLPDPQLSA